MPQPDPTDPTTDPAATIGPIGPSAVGRDLDGASIGDFQVGRLLGRGGMGEVYLATQSSLNRPVAFKVLRSEMLSNPNVLSRFQAEATAVARLNHPNIVHVYTLGSVDGLRFIAMEYVQGTNLREYLNRKGTVDLPLALSIMRQTAQAIAAAGEIGLIHRDVKPENLLLTRKGQVKVADFGLCREQGPEALNLTQPGVTLGTPMYMSPEQVQGKPLDHRSDLYSLGVTFYHMLAGRPPFTADAPVALALKHIQEVPASLAVHRPDLPPELVALVMKLLAKDPDDRYATAKDLLRDISKIRESALAQGSARDAEVTDGIPTPVTPSAAALSTVRLPRLRRPGLPTLGRRTIVAVGLIGLIAGAMAGWLGRAPDLLAARAPAPAGPPGLWLDPDWRQVPRLATARDQYRAAQLAPPGTDRRAAWLAVPGHFPGDANWSTMAYTQLARHLLRNDDRDGLLGLAADLDRVDPEADGDLAPLAAVSRAAAAALDDDPDEVFARFSTLKLSYVDPALVEIGLEITARLRGPTAADAPGLAPRLNRLQADLIQALRIDPIALAELP